MRPNARKLALATAAALFAAAGAARAEDGGAPSPIAATRPELKQWVEDAKRSKPRLPLPPPTAAEIAEAEARSHGRPAAPGLHGIINNGRMRQRYLPRELTSGGFSREPDPAMTLTSAFKTMLFWVVSRANNCAYCQGHQETKLAAEGVSEDAIAALDGDWSEFTPAERAAFTFTKKLTYRPDTITDADIAALRPFYKDPAILEIALTVAGNNAMNRWTGALAIPQEADRVYLTPTAPKYATARSLVAPLDPAAKLACAPPASRGELPGRAAIEQALEACRARTPRLPLVDESQARALVPGESEGGPLPEWVRLLATFPKYGPSRVKLHNDAATKGTLDPKLRAQIAWVSALNDRAWYALGHAQAKLKALGESDDAIAALGADPKTLPPGERAALALARKLTVDPARLTDGDVEAIRAHFDDKQTAEIIFQVTEAAFFDRLTEAANLRLER